MAQDRCLVAEMVQQPILRRCRVPEQILAVKGLEADPGELAAALSGVDLLTGELLELFRCHYDRAAIPVGGQQIPNAII